MSVARFDFLRHDTEYYQETLLNLKVAIKSTKKLCSDLDTKIIVATARATNTNATAVSANIVVDERQMNALFLDVAVKKGDTIFLGQYLFSGSETTSFWLEIDEKKGDYVVYVVENSATVSGSLFTMHASNTY